jgi:DNA-binding LacI/PurR family transcriptional regulator
MTTTPTESPSSKATPFRASTPPARVQMADIARLAGIAVSTVSRALSGSPLVTEATRKRVLELAQSLNYSVNVGAKNLRLKHNNTIAVVVPLDAQTGQTLSDPFFLSLIGSIADACTDRGHDMLLTRVDANFLSQAAQLYTTGRAMGVIVIGQWHHHDQLNEMAAQHVPLVVWGAQMPQQLYCTVGGDNVQGGQLATAHLLETGAHNIAFLGDISLPEIAQRHEGYVRAHQQAGLSVQDILCRSVPFVDQAIAEDMEVLLRQHSGVDALFASSDLAAMTAISALRRLGQRIPDDIRVVGYDDISLAVHYQPSLTTIRQPIDAAGSALVDSLLSQIEHGRAKPVVLRTELITRETTGSR